MDLSTILDDNTLMEKYTNDCGEAQILHEWNDLRKMLWKSQCVVHPKRFVSIIQGYAKNMKNTQFTGFAQNDASEFLIFLMDTFDKALRHHVVMNVRGTVENETDKTGKACYEMMKTMYSTKYSAIIQNFHGIQATQIIGVDGTDMGKILSVCPEPTFVLNLPLPRTSPRQVLAKSNIMDCLKHYCTGELMNGDNQWMNDVSGKKENVVRRTRFWSLPDTLIMSIGRNDSYGRKHNTLVEAPTEMLDMSRYMCGYERETYKYKLYAICNHMGGVGGGHYTANVRVNDLWYEFNDTRVNRITKDPVTTAAYLFFWRRI